MTGSGIKEWLTSSEIAAARLPDLPQTRQGIELMIAQCGWRSTSQARPRAGRGGGYEYHISLLPPGAQLRLRQAPAAETWEIARARKNLLWSRFNSLSKAQKAICEERLKVINRVEQLVRERGLNRTAAIGIATLDAGVQKSAYYEWRKATEGVDREDWLAALAPASHAPDGPQLGACHPEAWDFLKSDFLRPEKPGFSACYRRMMEAAQVKGWSPIPSERSLRRRLEADVPKGDPGADARGQGPGEDDVPGAAPHPRSPACHAGRQHGRAQAGPVRAAAGPRNAYTHVSRRHPGPLFRQGPRMASSLATAASDPLGGVFFRRTAAPKSEVINDRNGEVVNLFRILQRHYPQFMDTLKFQITSRREFERLKSCDPATLTDLERAARFLYLQKLAFGGKVSSQNFGVDVSRSARFNLTRLAPMLEDVHERLAGVVLENLDWSDFIDRYDRPGTLFYLDPPYFGSEDDYGRALFGRDQFAAMAERLKRLQGRFILSINDMPEIRALFSRFGLQSEELTYSVGGGKGTSAKELIVCGGGDVS